MNSKNKIIHLSISELIAGLIILMDIAKYGILETWARRTMKSKVSAGKQLLEFL
jgi:hypothetical protein